MPDERRPLIEIPDDDAMVEIANQAVNGQLGSVTGEGDLPDWNLNGDNDRHERDPRPSRPERAAVHGQVSYANVPLGNDFLYAFGAADEMIMAREGETSTYLEIPESQRMALYIKGLVGRDMQADERRPPEKKVYWLGGLYQGATYKNLIADTHMRDFDQALKQQWEARGRIQFKRARETLGPEWSDEKIAYLLALDSTDDE